MIWIYFLTESPVSKKMAWSFKYLKDYYMPSMLTFELLLGTKKYYIHVIISFDRVIDIIQLF